MQLNNQIMINNQQILDILLLLYMCQQTIKACHLTLFEFEIFLYLPNQQQFLRIESMDKQNILEHIGTPDKQSFKLNFNSKTKRQRGSNPSIFIAKTFEILENGEYQETIRWNPDGNSFIIDDTEKFQQEVLPIYFRHRNFSSFVRQLNMYDFHKIRNEANRNIFQHKEFRRKCRDSLKNIKRKGCTSAKKLSKQQIVDDEREENYSVEPIQSIKTVGNIGMSRATVQNSHSYISRLSPLSSSNRINLQEVDIQTRKRLTQEFIQDLPDIVKSEAEIQQIIRGLKDNPKYECISSKKEMKKIVKKIKQLKLPKFENPNDLQDLSIQQQMIVDNVQGINLRNPSLAIFSTQKCIPLKSMSIIGSLNLINEGDHLLYPN